MATSPKKGTPPKSTTSTKKPPSVRNVVSGLKSELAAVELRMKLRQAKAILAIGDFSKFLTATEAYFGESPPSFIPTPSAKSPSKPPAASRGSAAPGAEIVAGPTRGRRKPKKKKGAKLRRAIRRFFKQSDIVRLPQLNDWIKLQDTSIQKPGLCRLSIGSYDLPGIGVVTDTALKRAFTIKKPAKDGALGFSTGSKDGRKLNKITAVPVAPAVRQIATVVKMGGTCPDLTPARVPMDISGTDLSFKAPKTSRIDPISGPILYAPAVPVKGPPPVIRRQLFGMGGCSLQCVAAGCNSMCDLDHKSGGPIPGKAHICHIHY